MEFVCYRKMGSVKDAGLTVTISMGLPAYPLLSTATYITYLSRRQLNFTLQSTIYTVPEAAAYKSVGLRNFRVNSRAGSF